MVEVFGAGTAVHFNPKNLGANTGFSGLFSDGPGLDFEQVGTKFSGLF